MLDNARRNFCTVTELANYLVRHDGISFREAHEIIAHVVGTMCETHRTSADIDRAAVNAACKSLFGFETKLTDALISEALDPKRVVSEKKVIGGTHPDEVTRQLDAIEKAIEADEAVLGERKAQLAEADKRLAQAVNEVIEK